MAYNFTVTAFDPYRNIATGYLGTVHFSSSDPDASLPTNYTFAVANAGTMTFSATLVTAGTQKLTATDTTTSTITGTESNITVQASAAQFLTVSGFPTTETAGVPYNFTVTAFGPNGKIDTGYVGTSIFPAAIPTRRCERTLYVHGCRRRDNDLFFGHLGDGRHPKSNGD